MNTYDVKIRGLRLEVDVSWQHTERRAEGVWPNIVGVYVWDKAGKRRKNASFLKLTQAEWDQVSDQIQEHAT